MKHNQKKRKVENIIETETIDQPRKSFTPGWTASLNEHERLPIKNSVSGNIIYRKHIIDDSDNDDSDEDVKETEEHEENHEVDSAADDEKKSTENESKPKPISQRKQPQHLIMNQLSSEELQEHQQLIATICNAVIINPSQCVTKKKLRRIQKSNDAIDEEIEGQHHISQLFELLTTTSDALLYEQLTLSLLLVFKDICPSYRIKKHPQQQQQQQHQQLSKEVKEIHDFEVSLLFYYHLYIEILQSRLMKTLPPHAATLTWGALEKIALNCLRCLCELFQTFPSFNFSSLLIHIIVTYSLHSNENVVFLCCEIIKKTFFSSHDEIIYELVVEISKNIQKMKYSRKCMKLLSCLTSISLKIHQKDSKLIHLKAKSFRKKVQKQQQQQQIEEEEKLMQLQKKRFQADTLHEISLLYFRIIKQKVGFSLLPITLKGLSRITHLINIDMIHDLIKILHQLLIKEQSTTAATAATATAAAGTESLQMHCIHCILHTLSGPGAELQLDHEIYLKHFQNLLCSLPSTFNDWQCVVEIIELCCLKNYETNSCFVLNFIRKLFLITLHSLNNSIGNNLLIITHKILQRYPRIRQDLKIFQLSSAAATAARGAAAAAAAAGEAMNDDDDVVEDLAMKALIDEKIKTNKIIHDTKDEERLNDGSFSLFSLYHHPDPMLNKQILPAMTSKEIQPILIQTSSSSSSMNNEEELLLNLKRSIDMLPKKKIQKSLRHSNKKKRQSIDN